VRQTIEFNFYPANHSVVRAEYGFPCIPYEMTGNNKVGFFSGFNAVDKVLDDPPKYSLKINDTNPIFFYCSAPGSCITYAMVGTINPNTTTSISTQQQKARDSAYMLNPGEPFPAESPLPSNLPSSTSIPSVGGHKSGLGTGAIVGVVVAALGVILLGASALFFWRRSKTLKDEVERKRSSIGRRSSGGLMGMVHTPNTLAHGSADQHYASPTGSQPHPHPHPHAQQHSMYFSPPLPPPMDAKLQSPPPPPPPPGHPAYSVPTRHPAFPAHSMYSDTSHHAASTPFELSPHGSTYYPQQTLSPQQEHRFGPHGRQRDSPAPLYGWHVNASPAEIEGTPVSGGVQKERESERERAGGIRQDRERVRWEEVSAESGERQMF
jgi:hypothetical protein